MTTTFPPVPGTLARPRPAGVAAWLAIVALLGLGCWALGDLRLNLATLVDSGHNAVDFAGRMFPLDFPPVGELLTLCGQTLAIVVSATLLSVLLSAPLAVVAAANTTPGPAGRFGSRAVIVLSRAVPDVVLAIVFFRIFGLGAMTGVLAMGLHSVGMVAKLYADAIEQIDEGPRTAVRAGGAGRGPRARGGCESPTRSVPCRPPDRCGDGYRAGATRCYGPPSGSGGRCAGSVHGAGTLRASPQNCSTSSGTPNGVASGLQREQETTPGSNSSMPPKRLRICIRLRRIMVGVPDSFHRRTASFVISPCISLVVWAIAT